MEFEDIIESIGGYGIYQRIIIWFLYFPMCIISGIGMINIIFIVNTPDFWCKKPQFIQAGINFSMLKPLTCEIYTNYSLSVKDYNYSVGNASECTCNPKCGYDFDLTKFGRTVITDWELVCLDSSWPVDRWILMVTNIGGLIGSVIFGYTLDKFGRKTTLIICVFSEILFGAVSAASPEIISFTVFRFILAFGIIIALQGATTAGIEWVPPSQRMFIACGTNCFFAIGCIIAIGIASGMDNWIYYSLATSLPFSVFGAFYWFLPESPQWLVSQNRCKEAEELLKRAAKINKKTPPPDLSNLLQALADRQEGANSANIVDLVRTPNIRKKTLILSWMWLIFGLDYLGLSYYAQDLAGNMYVNFILSSATEIPSYILAWPVVDYWGRRWPITVFMIIGGLACLIMTSITADMKTSKLVLFLIGKFFISSSTVMGFPFTGELFPTVLRGIGSGVASLFIVIGFILAPIIEGLEKTYPGVPLYIFGILAFITGVMVLFLPETLNTSLPQTLLDGENFGKNMTYKEWFRCCPIRNQEHQKAADNSATNEDFLTVRL